MTDRCVDDGPNLAVGARALGGVVLGHVYSFEEQGDGSGFVIPRFLWELVSKVKVQKSFSPGEGSLL